MFEMTSWSYELSLHEYLFFNAFTACSWKFAVIVQLQIYFLSCRLWEVYAKIRNEMNKTFLGKALNLHYWKIYYHATNIRYMVSYWYFKTYITFVITSKKISTIPFLLWLQKAAQKYGIRGIPTLIILKKNGEMLSNEGRGHVAGSGNKWPEQWK